MITMTTQRNTGGSGRFFELGCAASAVLLMLGCSMTAAHADLPPAYRNTPVLIKNIFNGSCLAVEPNYGYVSEVSCNASAAEQQFSFDVQTYVGGLGFVYHVHPVDQTDPPKALMHLNNGATFFAPGEAVEGFSYREVRIQHDEDDAFIEFRRTGRCLEKGPAYSSPITTACDWFGQSPQHYRLILVSPPKGGEDDSD